MTEYRTIQGDTWDMIAYKIWGDCMLTGKLMEANSALVETVIFSAGVILTIPDVSMAEEINLPPWKR